MVGDSEGAHAQELLQAQQEAMSRLSGDARDIPFDHPHSSVTLYMYRAQSDVNYSLSEGLNLGNAEGVLWYLHNEVVRWCPRHYDITRIIRYKVTIKTSAQRAAEGRRFGIFLQFDNAKCTNGYCREIFEKYGYIPGCIINAKSVAGYWPATWYSLPGSCPFEAHGHKTEQCMEEEPGGACPDPDGSKTCTYHMDYAGEVRLDDLTGRKSCNSGDQADTQRPWWWGKKNAFLCKSRVKKLRAFFKKLYPDMPEELPEPKCDGF